MPLPACPAVPVPERRTAGQAGSGTLASGEVAVEGGRVQHTARGVVELRDVRLCLKTRNSIVGQVFNLPFFCERQVENLPHELFKQSLMRLSFDESLPG